MIVNDNYSDLLVHVYDLGCVKAPSSCLGLVGVLQAAASSEFGGQSEQLEGKLFGTSQPKVLQMV